MASKKKAVVVKSSLVRKHPPPSKKKIVKAVRNPREESTPAKTADVLRPLQIRVSPEGVILSKVVVSPEGVVLQVLEE